MLKEAIYHKTDRAYAYPLDTNTVSITLRAKKDDLKSCHLFYGDVWEPKVVSSTSMGKVASDDLFDYFRIILNVPSRRLRYLFLLDDGKERLWYSEKGFSSEMPNSQELGLPFFEILYIRENDVFSTPEWAKGAVVYQIFSDRFYNGDKSNDPTNVAEWGSLPVTDETFYGGDLRGIIEKLPYLSELGIEAIYLNPIFSSPSPHKYDTTDYYQIDSNFGDLKTFDKLIERSHELGIKIILDGVFNHCGYNFWAFQDVVKKGPKSKYVDWFNIYSFPIRTTPKPSYETWGEGIWQMPRLMTHNPEVKKYLLDVAVYWVKQGVDGWRLDCAGEVDHAFWREFRKAVKEANPEAILIGEVSHHASPWLQGDQFDSVMNYHFRQAVIDFFAKSTIDAEEFDARLAKLRMMYKEPVNHVLYNLIGSHDTVRFLSLCGNKIEKMMLAIIFQFTYPGMPVIYYGDEIGMIGEKNHLDSRRAMNWEKPLREKKELFELYKKLIALRKNYPALKIGEFLTHSVDPKRNIYSYIRRWRDEEVLVVLNNSANLQSVTIPTPKNWSNMLISDILSGKECRVADEKIRLSLKPYSGTIFLKPR